MAFSFGNTSQSAFGTPQKTTGFAQPMPFGTPTTTSAPGAPFGGFGTATASTAPTAGPSFGFGTPSASAAPAAAPSFGFGGSAFGTPAAQSHYPAPTGAFGGSTFGQPTAAVAPTFGGGGGGFGIATTTASSTPAFGGGFGMTTTSATPTPAFGGGGFGAAATTTAPTFGSSFGLPAATTTPSLFGSTTTKPSLFGTPTTNTLGGGLFSTPASSAAPNLFGTPAPTQATTSLFGSTPTPGLFGSAATPATTSAAPLFGGFGATATATTSAPNLFGSTGTTNLFGQTTTPSLFGGFGGTTTTTTTASSGFGGFGGFGTTTTTTASGLFGGFGAKPITSTAVATNTAPIAPVQETQLQKTLASFYSINVFADERDDVLKKWNMLQACWGTGKGYYNSNQPPVEYDHSNPFYRFKAVGYAFIPKNDNSEGLVKIWMNKKESELKNQKDALINSISGILGNKPNLTVSIECMKGLSDTQTEIMITVSEKGVTGSSRKIPATDLSTFFDQPLQKQQLTNVGVTAVAPYVTPSKAQLEEYLKSPPPGVDIQMWKAAQADNPDPNTFIPTPINGFSDLKKRMLCLKHDSGLHRAFLVKVNGIIIELKKKHATSVAQITEQKQKFLELQHRLLRVLVKQEATRKIGIALQPEEEKLKERFEVMNNILNMPSQFKAQLNELVATVRMMGTLAQPREHYKMDPQVQDDVKQFLKMEQNGISHLVKIINEDLKALKIISEGMNDILGKK